MLCLAPIRFVAAAGLALAASLPAQSPQTSQAKLASTPVTSTLPATQPTATPDPPPLPLTPSQRPPQRAQITFANGTLSISADNASLNQILRQIASETGMKITGGVIDERVFGQYGPAAPPQILADLLDGTSSNMILVHGDGNAPAELILTPRQGGPSPPNPNAHAFDDRLGQLDGSPVRGVQPEGVIQNAQPTTSPVTQATPAGGPSPANASQPDSPNGVKTPQQIYEQLQRMRQQSQPQQTTQPQ
jgi:hypothetical protein